MRRIIMSVLAAVGIALGAAACGGGGGDPNAAPTYPLHPHNADYMAGWNWSKANPGGDCQAQADEIWRALESTNDYQAGCVNAAGQSWTPPAPITINIPPTTTTTPVELPVKPTPASAMSPNAARAHCMSEYPQVQADPNLRVDNPTLFSQITSQCSAGSSTNQPG